MRVKSSVVGLFLGLAIVYYAILNTGDDSAIFMNLLSIVIVFGGSFSVAIITQGVTETLSIMMLFFKAFSTAQYNNITIVKELVEISKKLYFAQSSINKIANSDIHPFTMDGLRLIENKIETNKINKIMTTMLESRNNQHDERIEKLETLSKYPPAFGMMGTIIGLVAVLNQMSSASDMSKIGPSMAVALITTLYGIFLANYIIQPISDNLVVRSQEDIKVRMIICEAVNLISRNEDPVFIREILLGHLSPSERKIYLKNNTEESNNQTRVAA